MPHLLKLFGYDPWINYLLWIHSGNAWLARYTLEEGNYLDALGYLKASLNEAINVNVAHSNIQCYIQFLFASVYLHMHQHEESLEHLKHIDAIVDKLKSHASPNIRSCCLILYGLINLLDGKPKEAFNCVLRAQTVHLQANNYLDMPSTTLTLWNMCHVHKQYSLSRTRRIRLERYMSQCFDIFELDKRFRGGSNDNRYRRLLAYAEQIQKDRQQSVEFRL
ncbi:unnamed protein product [Rotaria sp. Silwood2]|nr:unnamed protein product [Rotaria sp. Silwood2]CAF4112129.1 unnamed protein product [Rotaria sp. Silwood2]